MVKIEGKFVFDPRKFDIANEETVQEAERQLERAGAVGQRVARKAAPIRTGALRRSTKFRKTGRLQYVLEATVDYAKIQNKKHRFIQRGGRAIKKELS